MGLPGVIPGGRTLQSQSKPAERFWGLPAVIPFGGTQQGQITP